MNRNVESHFAERPSIEIQRSMFDRSFSHKTSFDVGYLIPFCVEEILPGDTFKVTTSIVARLQTLLSPIMDNIYLDTYWFFVPNRLTWKHWKNFMGESENAWIPETNYSIPVVSFPENGFDSGSIADYMGIPTGEVLKDRFRPNALPFRAYAMICDQWFRDQNLIDPLVISDGDEVTPGPSLSTTEAEEPACGGDPFRVAKYHDYFTSCLPSPQNGIDVSIFGEKNKDPSFPRMAPVVTGESHITTKPETFTPLLGWVNIDTFDSERNLARVGSSASVQFGLNSQENFEPSNLWANVGALDLSINQLRLAFQLQRFYEKLSNGRRYKEVLLNHFGVHSPDARLQIPEYLGGHRIPLQIHQIANQSQGENDFLGDLGAMSNTSDVHEDFVKSFTEHGYLIGVMCARYDHSYPEGLSKMWFRKYPLDFYWPVFANIGEQPVFTAEIRADSDTGEYDVFGYNEAWADYRFKPNRVSGQMRPKLNNGFATWHLADDYREQPLLSDAWIREDPIEVDRVLAVTSQQANQIFADIYVNTEATRPMPMFSVPGLADHH